MSFFKFFWNNDMKQKCDGRESLEVVGVLST